MTSNTFRQFLPDETAMIAFGQKLISAICRVSTQTGITLYLNGDLGAGKTTLSRGMIQGLGHQGNVKSPTYTLVEEYHLQGKQIYHFDLYRLSDPEELEFMGIRDYFSANSICLVEWAEKGAGLLAEPDLMVNIAYINNGREIVLVPNSTQGEQILNHLK